MGRVLTFLPRPARARQPSGRRIVAESRLVQVWTRADGSRRVSMLRTPGYLDSVRAHAAPNERFTGTRSLVLYRFVHAPARDPQEDPPAEPQAGSAARTGAGEP